MVTQLRRREKMENVIYRITKIEANKPEVSAELTTAHINEILALIRQEINVQDDQISLGRLEVLDDVLEALKYTLRGE
jgi:hypothetical protein